jgi:plasmid stability protein
MDPFRRRLSVNISIKNVPEALAQRLRDRAEKNRRSLQRELLVILEEAAGPRLSAREAMDRVRELGLKTPGDSVRLIRQMRDAR